MLEFTKTEINILFEMLCRIKDLSKEEYSLYAKVREYWEEN